MITLSTLPDETFPDLLEVSDEEFNDYVNADIRGTADAQVSAGLRQSDVLDRWYNCLLANKNNVDAQLANNRAERAEKFAECTRKGSAGKQEWIDYVASQERWKSGAIRFKNGTEVKLVEAKSILRKTLAETGTPVLIRERNDAVQTANRLREAITRHRDTVEDDEVEADEALWANLED